MADETVAAPPPPTAPPPDVYSPGYTGGSRLGDILAGIGGANISRPAIGNFIANGQALAQYRSAQTENALVRAQQDREAAQARDQVPGLLKGMGYSDSESALLSNFFKWVKNPNEAAEMIRTMQTAHFEATAGNPANLGQPAATAAVQALAHKIQEPFAIGPQYGTAPGMPQPNVNVTPLGTADINEKNALAAAANQRAAGGSSMDPELAPIVARFLDLNPASASNFRSLTSNAGPLVVAAYMAEHGDEASKAYLIRKMSGAPSAPRAAATAASAGLPANGGAPAAGGTPAPVDLNAPQHQPPNGITPAPGVSLKEQADIRSDFAKGTGAKQVTALGTATLHSLLWESVADQMQNGQFTPSNTVNALWLKIFGKPAPTSLKLVGDFLGREAVRATVNAGAGTGEERELHIGNDASPEQFHDGANKMRALLAGQAHSLEMRARRGGVDISQLLVPEAQQAFNIHPGGAGPNAVTATAPSQNDLIDAEIARRMKLGLQ